MSHSETSPGVNAGKLESLASKLEEAIRLLAEARDFAKPTKIRRVFDTARRILLQEGGCEVIERLAPELEQGGVFWGSDWAEPSILIPSLSTHSLKSPEPDTVVIEAISELRLLAIAKGRYTHPSMSAEQAHHYLTQVLAMNLELLFGTPSEAEREQQGRLANVTRSLFRH
ncbi:MAG: hypothetical protein R3303_07765, partial [Marinobacter sp.]|nr:hypothetical protein [Marinobacter sp.]